MLTDSDANSRYLSLALDARRVVDALVSFLKDSPTPQMPDIVRQTIESLKSVQDREVLLIAVTRNSLFGDYERLSTLEEVQSASGSVDVSNELNQLLRHDVDETAKKRSAEAAVQFFCALEGRALQHYAQAIDI